MDGDSGEVEQRLNCPITFSVPDDEFVGRLAVALKGFECWYRKCVHLLSRLVTIVLAHSTSNDEQKNG